MLRIYNINKLYSYFYEITIKCSHNVAIKFSQRANTEKDFIGHV